MKQILEQNKNYEVTVHFIDPTISELRDYDLVIFHELPKRSRNLKDLVSALDEQNTSRIYIIGGEAQLNQFNRLQSHISVVGSQGNTSDTQAELNLDFKNFSFDENLKTSISRLPPLASPFGEYEVNGNVEIFLYQSIGGISTDFPLVAFAESEGTKSGYNFWK